MIRRVPARWPALCLGASLCCGGSTRLAAAEKLQFNRDIRPLLSDRCFKCHGPDQASRKAGLRLDLATSAYAERKHHRHAVVPGNPEESLLCRKIFATDPEDRMPPPESHLSLSQAEKERLRLWIAQGAQYQPPWSFIPLPDRVPVPAVRNRRWPRNPIDNFILARLEPAGLEPSPAADRARWLRRVTYDLIGLPPTPRETAAFLADHSRHAYERVVDRLLASPHFGERMAVPWLDAARYADSYGYQSDQLCPTWPYRDWVVQAFNRNLAYDRFLTDQLAGDLLPHPTAADRLATAFNRLHRQTNEGGSIEEEWRTEYVSDRVATFSTAMLGLTFQCAHCHDHKFDPITQRDYYSLFAFFNSIDEWGLYNDTAHVPTPSLLLPTPEQQRAITEADRVRQEALAALARVQTQAEPGFRAWLRQSNLTATIPGLTAAYSFDTLGPSNRFVNAVNSANTSTVLRGNTLVPGKSGQAVQFTGDDELTFPGVGGSLQPWEPYTVLFWLERPTGLTNGVIFHRCEGTDTGFHGTELSLEDSHLFFVIKRFWPGNALAVRSVAPVPAGRWVQVAVSVDGSARAQGITLFLDGQPAPVEVVRNQLTKSPENGGSGFTFGALFRSTGLKGGRLDELRVYNRALAPIEVRQLCDGQALAEAMATRDLRALRPYYLAALAPGVAQARQQLCQAVHRDFEARNPVLESSVMEELPQPRPAYILVRGRYDSPKRPDLSVTRATPAMLPPFPPHAPRNRLGLAEWLTDPHHPLTSRVAVNRFWAMVFGRGIVATPDNFGAQGAEPTHPRLLDWLARDFIDSGWDVKALLKKMVLSATYRQDSRLRPELQEQDPENLLLARGPSERLTAEMIRDTALAASGLLDGKMGGPPVSPYLAGDFWRAANGMSPPYHQSVGGDLYRRSVYTVWKRTAPMPDMTAFDAPSREVCVVQRSTTATPQQAFVLLNDEQFVEAARVLAEEALAQPGATPVERIRFAFRHLTAREPDARETTLLTRLLREEEKFYGQEPARATKVLAVGQHPRNSTLNPVEVAATTAVTQTIMNLDATVWKR